MAVARHTQLLRQLATSLLELSIDLGPVVARQSQLELASWAAGPQRRTTPKSGARRLLAAARDPPPARGHAPPRARIR